MFTYPFIISNEKNYINRYVLIVIWQQVDSSLIQLVNSPIIIEQVRLIRVRMESSRIVA